MKDVDMQTSRPTLDNLIRDKNFRNLLSALAYKQKIKYSQGASIIIDEQDLVNEGMTAATVAYKKFDHTRGVLFSTFAYPYVKSAMDVYCRKFGHVLTISEKDSRNHLGQVAQHGVTRIDQSYRSDSDEAFDIPVGSGVEYSSDVDEYFLMGFTPLECDLVKDNILVGLSMSELAAKYKISRSRVGTMLKDLKDRMRERAERYVADD